jgi:quinohemoprotein ethanol dehydrogenase
VEGVIYVASGYSFVHAVDAKTGKLLWRYDPEVAKVAGTKLRTGWGIRGLAFWKGRLFVGTHDGRLIAIDAKTGKPVWSVQTLDQNDGSFISGPPRVFNDKVVIGFGGGDFGAVRGYVTAYDTNTGKQLWRWWTVPGDPSKGFENKAMEMAAKTWTGEWWKYGGGGTVWNAMTYDPEFNRVYIGTGNGGPWNWKIRSPGGGDNLFLCSMVAVDARTGKYRWHYQEIPAEEWDYDCTSPMILADLKIGGQARPVVLHAPKDGFFYVVDRRTGKLISAKNYVPNTWASGVDMKTGRPKVYPDALVAEKPHLMTPGFGGGHNWNPMSFSPKTGLVYIPAQEQWMVESVTTDDDYKFVLGQTTIGSGHGNYPELRKELNEKAKNEKGYMLAWDPVRQKEAFRIPYPHPGNSGTMVTAGNLLVQGTIKKTLAIYRADNGKTLWEMDVGTVPSAGAATYTIKGRQYIAINAGWNSAIVQGLDEGGKQFTFSPARLLVFALDAKGVTLPPAPDAAAIPPPPAKEPPADLVAKGEVLYDRTCSTCHGKNAIGGVKDLRHLTAEAHGEFNDIVLGGKRRDKGMASFSDVLSKDDAEAIHDYLIARAQTDYQPDFLHPPARK